MSQSREVKLSHPNIMSVIPPLCWLALKKSLVLQGVHLENPLELLNNMLPVKFRFAKHLSFPLGIASLFSNYLFLTLFSLGLGTCQIHGAIYINSCSESTLDFYTPHLKIL